MNADKLIQYPTFKDVYEQRGAGGKLGESAEFWKANAHKSYDIHLSCYLYCCKMSLTIECCSIIFFSDVFFEVSCTIYVTAKIRKEKVIFIPDAGRRQ